MVSGSLDGFRFTRWIWVQEIISGSPGDSPDSGTDMILRWLPDLGQQWFEVHQVVSGSLDGFRFTRWIWVQEIISGSPGSPDCFWTTKWFQVHQVVSGLPGDFRFARWFQVHQIVSG